MRQGNLHLQMDKPVRILRLGVKQTLDVTGYQRLKIKESFIKQAMKGEVTERSLEEPETDSSDSTNFGQMMASPLRQPLRRSPCRSNRINLAS